LNTETLKEAWDNHYLKDKARLSYPDENLVRLLRGLPGQGPALDLGCGSGRHVSLLGEFGFAPLYGGDLSVSSVQLCRETYPEADFFSLDAEEFALPFVDSFFEVVVSWGVLHYNDAPTRARMLAEIRRVLRPGGFFLGTLRAAGDSHFKSAGDLKALDVEFFNEETTRTLLGEFFESLELGFMERTPLGRLDERICHWFFRAT